MPCDDGLGFHDAQDRSPFRPNTGEPNPKKTIGKRLPESLFLVLGVEDEKLMAQGKDLCLECSSRAERITRIVRKEIRTVLIAKKLLMYRAKSNRLSANRVFGRHRAAGD